MITSTSDSSNLPACSEQAPHFDVSPCVLGWSGPVIGRRLAESPAARASLREGLPAALIGPLNVSDRWNVSRSSATQRPPGALGQAAPRWDAL